LANTKEIEKVDLSEDKKLDQAPTTSVQVSSPDEIPTFSERKLIIDTSVSPKPQFHKETFEEWKERFLRISSNIQKLLVDVEREGDDFRTFKGLLEYTYDKV
jgi:hypothetical protein